MNDCKEAFAVSVARTRGAQAIAEDDARRMAWLDAQVETWKADADTVRRHSGQHRNPSKYRDRRKKVVEVAP